jgi:hypothetical protein
MNSERVYQIKGDVWMRLGNNLSREQVLANPDNYFENLIVNVCSELIASWAIADNTINFPYIPGGMTLAVGTGDVGWDLQNPPAETPDLTLLYSELYRKQFTTRYYVDINGNSSPTRTNIVDYLTTFLDTEAVGPLVEMGLFGGTGALSSGGGTRMNAKHFKVINKPATSELSILWRLTF